jgi:glycosyltransferase involved in cell wall biosynthesis
MRILHIVGRSKGGIRQHVHALNSELKSKNIESTVIAPHGTMDGLSPADITYVDPRILHPLSILKCSNIVSKNIQNYDVLHAHGIIPAVLAIRARNKSKINIPIVITLHNLAVRELEGKKYTLKHLFELRILNKVDHVICPSNYVSKLVSLVVNSNVTVSTVLPIGKKTTRQQIAKAKLLRDSTRKHYSIDLNSPLCISLSRYTPQKDIPTLVNAFKLVCDKNAKAQLLIAGYGSTKTILKCQEHAQKIGLKNNIHFFSNVLEPENLMAASDLFVLASIYETVPLVLVEALEFGLPVVMTDVGIAKETLNTDTGSTVPIGDAEAFSVAVLSWLDRIKNSGLNKHAFHSLSKELTSVENTVDPIVEIYNELLNDKN